MALSSDDDARLARLGFVFDFNFACICPQLILYGIYICIFPYSVIVLLRRSNNGYATYGLIGLTTALLVFTTLDVASWIATLVTEFRMLLIDTRLPFEQRSAHASKLLDNIQRLDVICQSINYIIADAIVMWRAWVLYPSNKIVRSFMIFTVFCNTVLNLSYTILANIQISGINGIVPSVDSALNITSWFLSFATNLVATLLIFFRGWQHRKELNFRGIHRRTKAQGILVLFVETGFLLCIMQLFSSILAAFNFQGGAAQEFLQGIVNALSFFAAVLVPTLLIIIVGRENSSVIDSHLSSGISSSEPSDRERAGGSGNPVSTLRFASVHTGTSHDTTRVVDSEKEKAGEGKSDKEA